MHKHEDQQDTLLIVDDTPENISVLFEFLIAHDFKVLVAENGESALINAVPEHPALILLDVMMPGGIDGFETCRQLK
jgi:CheY-like chemotaxis protein